MKPTKKQIAEVTLEAEKKGVTIETALRCLSNCSVSIYKTIGAAGLVNAAIESDRMVNANGILLDRCEIIKYTDKAVLINLPMECRAKANTEKWIPLSIIVDGVIPFWALNK